nr:adhesion G protein-coupled receptor E2-like isoform X2 [Chrysemys picta bellii]
MGTRGDVYPLGLCIALCLWGTVAQNHGVQGTTEDCNSHVLCPANAKCVNNTHCTCLDGYQPHGNRFFADPTEICDDINECLVPSPPDCRLNADCTNVAGSYYCFCSDGYESSSGKANFMNASENTCQGPSNNSGAEFEGIELTHRNFSPWENYPLTIIKYVGLTLSLLCLLLAILTFLLCRSIRNVSTSLHLQLCLCLCVFHWFIFNPLPESDNQVACAVIAALLHFLFLACFSWMLLEGLHLFLTVRNLQVVNYTSASRFIKRFMYPFGYGFPALVVAISAAVNHKGYGFYTHCWLSPERGFLWSFLGPVFAIILINITFFALTLWILRKTLSSLNADVSTLRDHSLQGPFIFLVHCLLNRQVREEYRRWIKGFRMFSTKSQTSDLSMSAVPTTSTKTVEPFCQVESAATRAGFNT